MTTRRWVDWVNVMLGVWLIASPWLLTVAAGDRPAAWSAWSVGAGIVTLAIFAMRKPAIWGDALGVMLGAWLMGSPWMLELASASVAAANAVIIGLLVIGYALWAMRIDITSGAQRLFDERLRAQ
jgi:SPW repeat